VRLRHDGDREIHLKLENLQPIGSFKLRGASNAVLQIPLDELQAGVVTATAGNMGQGMAWIAQELGVPCTVVVPDHAPETKLDAMARLGARIDKVEYHRWWEALESSSYPKTKGVFIHPVQDERVMAGNGTIGLELLEDLPAPDTVLVPFGGGGLSVGIASAVKALRPETRVYAVEPEPGAPGRFSAATAARLRRMLRLRADLGVNLAGAAIIVDLMECLDRLDAELMRRRGRRWT